MKIFLIRKNAFKYEQKLLYLFGVCHVIDLRIFKFSIWLIPHPNTIIRHTRFIP